MYTPSYNNNLAWEMVRVVGIIYLAKKDHFFAPPERHLTKRTGAKYLLLHLFLIWRPEALLVDLDRVIIANKSILMLESIINTQPTSDFALGLISTLTISWISTFELPYGPSSQVDIQLIACVDTRPCTTSSVGFVYLLPPHGLTFHLCLFHACRAYTLPYCRNQLNPCSTDTSIYP